MDDLVAFLNARLDEDEAVAKAAASDDSPARSWTDEERGYPVTRPLVEDGWHVVVVPPGATWGQVRHIARHDPARVLRAAEADRRLLDLYERAKNYRDQVFARPEPRSISDEMRAVTQMMALEQVLRLRAAVYSDHPDYRPEWKLTAAS